MIKRRVEQRLQALGLNPFEAARIVGLERSYINDLLIGKKQTIRGKKLPALAQVLDCDPDYLLGRQPLPRLSSSPLQGSLTVQGICEAGSWRDSSTPLAVPPGLHIEPDSRFPADVQSAYLVRGDHAAGLGITDGSLLCAVLLPALAGSGRSPRDGDVVLVRRRAGDLSELTARAYSETVSGVQLVAKPGRGEIAPVKEPDATVEALVLRAIRVFGPPS